MSELKIPEDLSHLHKTAEYAVRCALMDESSDGGVSEDRPWELRFIQAMADYETEGAPEHAEITPWSEAQTVCSLIERIASLEAERDALKARLAALEWKPITEDSLPNRGDEALHLPCSTHGAQVITVGFDSREGDHVRYLDTGLTHFRAINAPIPTPAAPIQIAQTIPNTSAGSQAGVSSTRPPASSTE